MLITKREIQCKRNNDVITFPAGSEVIEINGVYWIKENAFLRYDLIHLGCHVEANNVYCTDIFVRTEYTMYSISEEVFTELNKYNYVMGGIEGHVSPVGTRFLEMKQEDFIQALMYSVEKSYGYGNELLHAGILNSIELKKYKVGV